MDDVTRARAALDATREILGAGSESFDWAWSLVAAAESYELGLALTFASDAPPAAQLYYNPRRRTRAFREQARTVLAGFGFETSWLEVVDHVVPPEAVSTVLGFDVDRAAPVHGTLYFEEIDRRLGPRAVSALHELTEGLGLAVGAEADRIGVPYIWAVDFDARGLCRLKLYRSVPADARRALEDEVRRVTGADGASRPPSLEVLFGAGPCSGYMIQRAYDPRGEIQRHKVYRCHAYERGSTAGLAAGALRRLGLLSAADERWFDDAFGTTSIALSFTPGRRAFEYATVYQALLRGRRS